MSESRALKGRATLFVPGRLEVFGKHTDYAGGHSLVAAVPRGIRVTAEPDASGTVTTVDAQSDDRAVFDLRGNPDRAGGWHRYPATVIRRLASNFPGVDLSARISFASDLPQAAGLSSSSALIIGIAEALVACARIDETAEWRAAIRSLEDRASYFGCIENGSRFGPLVGDEGVGTHGGSEDHAAIILSRDGHLQQFSFAPLRSDRMVKMPEGWTFVIAWSGIAAAKTGAAMAAYNRLADPAGMRGDRLAHFHAENARVLEGTDAVARGDIAAVGELAAASQLEADRVLGNQVQETRNLVRLARERGAAAASSFGAGWGGSVWALVETPAAAPFLDAWLAAYRDLHPSLSSGGFISPPSDGLKTLKILPG